MTRRDSRIDRRNVLQGLGAAGMIGLAGCGGDGGDGGGGGGDDYPALGNYPVGEDEVAYGWIPPQSGPYSQEGDDELRAFNLAAKHQIGRAHV